MISRLLFHLKKQLTFHMNMLDIFFRFLPRFTTTIMLLYVSLVSSHWVKLLGVDSKQKKLQWCFDCILVSPRPPVPHSKVICLSPTHSNFQNYPHPKLHPALSTCYQILITSPKLIMYLCIMDVSFKIGIHFTQVSTEKTYAGYIMTMSQGFNKSNKYRTNSPTYTFL